jgi:hypothetical protein
MWRHSEAPRLPAVPRACPEQVSAASASNGNLTVNGSRVGDPSLRLKNGYAQNDADYIPESKIYPLRLCFQRMFALLVKFIL